MRLEQISEHLFFCSLKEYQFPLRFTVSVINLDNFKINRREKYDL